jgi:hypothetical protein
MDDDTRAADMAAKLTRAGGGSVEGTRLGPRAVWLAHAPQSVFVFRIEGLG